MPKLIDLTGQKFSRLTVISRAENYGYQAAWNVECECGNKTVIAGQSLRLGKTKSCGCLHKESARRAANLCVTHGMTNSGEYKIWENMIQRCANSNRPDYERYGGRGIEVCERWLKFENFYADMGCRPEGKTLDRIDNNKGYEQGNCRWASDGEQRRNKRNNRMVTFRGKTKCIAEWAEYAGINYATLKARIINYNWSVEKALTTPVGGHNAIT